MDVMQDGIGDFFLFFFLAFIPILHFYIKKGQINYE